MVFLLVIFLGTTLLVLAFGFLAAITLGMRLEDKQGDYGAIRADAERGALSRTGRRLVGLHIADN